jgi:hypothetical protein
VGQLEPGTQARIDAATQEMIRQSRARAEQAARAARSQERQRQFPTRSRTFGPTGSIGVLVQFGKLAATNPFAAALVLPSAVGVAANLWIEIDAFFAGQPQQDALDVIERADARARNNPIGLPGHDC